MVFYIISAKQIKLLPDKTKQRRQRKITTTRQVTVALNLTTAGRIVILIKLIAMKVV